MTYRPLPVAPSGYLQFGNEIRIDGSSNAYSSFSTSSLAATSTFYTIGPTGSGATHIWTPLDDIPASAGRVAIRVFVRSQANNTAAGTWTITLFAADNSVTPLLNSIACGVVWDSTTGASTQEGNNLGDFITIPVDSNRIFKLAYNSTGSGTGIGAAILYWRGWVV